MGFTPPRYIDHRIPSIREKKCVREFAFIPTKLKNKWIWLNFYYNIFDKTDFGWRLVAILNKNDAFLMMLE
jgi:hypothetical protein